MALFAHHPARVDVLRSAAEASDRAARLTRAFADSITGVSVEVPRAVEGTDLVDAARRPIRDLDERAREIEPAQRLQAKAGRLWADAVESFDGRVDALNRVWEQANPSGWQVGVAAATSSPLLGTLATMSGTDEHDVRTELRARLTRLHAGLEDQLDDIGDQIAATLDAGPGPHVDRYYRVMSAAMEHGRSQRRAAEQKLATFADRSWTDRLRAEIGGGVVHAFLGILDLGVLVSPFSQYDTKRPDVPKLDTRNLPSTWWERTLREHGLDTRGPAYNLADLATIAGLSLAPGAGPLRGVPLRPVRPGEPIPRFDTWIIPDKQGKHVPGHPHFDPERSQMLADPQVILPWAGSGQKIGRLPLGSAGSKERVDMGVTIGLFRPGRGAEPVPTSVVIIHYDKTGGMHMVPGRPRGH